MTEMTDIALNDDQKIQILEGAKELLGPNGENWTKSCWWGVKTEGDELSNRLKLFGYDVEPKDLSPEELRQIDNDEEGEILRFAVDSSNAEKANVWCLMGALEEVAYRLEITDGRDTSERLAAPISLRALVESKEEWEGWSVIDVNDEPETTFEMVRGLLDERLAQLKGEQS